MREQVTQALPVSDRDLERVLAGEAPAALAAHVEALAATHPALASHLRERRAEQAAFALQHPRLPERAHARPPSLLERLWGTPLVSGALAAACVLAFVVVEPGARDAVRDKGAASRERVTVIAKRGERLFRLAPGALLRAGDALRVEVACGAPSFVVLAVVEGDTQKAAVLVHGERVPAERTALQGSFVLDDHVGDEALVVACAQTPSLAKHFVTALQMGRRPAGATIVPFRKGP